MTARTFDFISRGSGLKYNVREWGSASNVCILIHGFGDGAFVWDDFGKFLAPSFRALAIDLRGHGDSMWSPERAYEIEHYVDDVVQLIDTVQCRSFALVGHSLGGEIAIRIADRLRSNVAGVVIVDFGPSLNQEGTDRVLADFYEGIRGYDSTAKYLSWLHQRRPLLSFDVLQRYANEALRWDSNGRAYPKCDPAIAAMNAARQNASETLWSMLTRIPVPILIVRGVGSAVLPGYVAEQMARRARNGELRTISAAGHAVMVDNPAEFCEVAYGFLSKLSADDLAS